MTKHHITSEGVPICNIVDFDKMLSEVRPEDCEKVDCAACLSVMTDSLDDRVFDAGTRRCAELFGIV